jgi:ATP-dependent helicase HepA
MSTFILGMKVKYLPQPEWGVGHVLSIEEEGMRLMVQFPTRTAEGPTRVNAKGGALVHATLSPGDLIQTKKGAVGVVAREEAGGRGLRRYAVTLDNGTEDEMPETELLALPPKPDLLSMLKDGRAADSKNFLLRQRVLKLDDERKNDALGALLASRVMVKPHQVGVVQRVLSSRRPRFILADEVGLGKTIEAGMIFSALKLAGLAKRVLVVAPSHLTVQWLVELFHKFNHLFTLMDTERYEASQADDVLHSPWHRFDLVVTSLELLQRHENHRSETADETKPWDLVIIDEAHHLKGEKAFEAAKGLAKNTWGLLLLTATPMQLDPAEYQSLLTLIDPVTAPTAKEFEARLARQEELSQSVRALLKIRSGSKHAAEEVQEAIQSLAKRFPHDEMLAEFDDPDDMIEHVSETYSLSNTLIRNRRATVGGFSKRKLHVHTIEIPKEELQAREAALEKLATEDSVRGAKFVGFVSLLKSIWKKEPQGKILVFTEARDTLESLQVKLRHEGIEALGYHGDLPLAERDRQVARFRDPDGPKVLLATEVGGEGRNFQFAHHLVNFDLPWSPATMEQRIGRLDRIGQQHDVDIHVFDLPHTFSSEVLTVLKDAVGVFAETVGGLDAVLEEVEPKLLELALAPMKKRSAYVAELKEKVEHARNQVKSAYDPLLDLRSFDKGAVKELIERAQFRGDIDADENESIEDGLWGIARNLDETLEEAITDVGDQIGLRVDTDKEVDAFQCAFHFGHALNVEALPGYDISEERTVLGTFWRDTAVEFEEIEYFATGHSLVEALFGFVKDGPFGRNGARFIETKTPVKAKGLEFLFHVNTPQAVDTSAGANVPSRQLSRFLSSSLIHSVISLTVDGKAKVDSTLLRTLKTAGRSLKGPELGAAFPELKSFVELAAAEAKKDAALSLKKIRSEAQERIEDERDIAMIRIKLSLEHQGVSADKIERALTQELVAYDELLIALSKTTVALDSACAFVVNR